MSCKVQQSVCSDCVTYEESRIDPNKINAFNNVNYNYDYRFLSMYMKKNNLSKKNLLEALGVKNYVSLILRLRLDHANELRRLEQTHRDREDTIRQHWQKKLDEQHDRLFSLIEKQQEELNRLRKKG